MLPNAAGVCSLGSTDWAADFPSCYSFAVSSCAVGRKTSLLVLALPWIQRPAQMQSKSRQLYNSICTMYVQPKRFVVHLSVLILNRVFPVRVMRG